MKTNITDSDLEGYLSDSLSPAKRQHVEKAISQSPKLQARLDELRQERETLEAVKDSFAIRLPEAEEQRIISKVSGKIHTALQTE